MPWIGTTCMIKMIELHSRVRVAFVMLLSRVHEVDYNVDYDAICLLL